MLVTRMSVEAGAMPDRHVALEDGDIPGDPAVHLRQPASVARHRATGSIRGAHDAWRGACVQEEPGDRHVECSGQGGEGLERRRGLVVLDLAEVADVQARQLRHPCERETPLGAPPTNAASDERPLTAGGLGFHARSMPSANGY